VLTIAGDFDIEETKQLINAYFGDIPKGSPVARTPIIETPIIKEIIDSTYDPNIRIPGIVAAYRTPGKATHDSKVLELISAYLSSGASSKLYKKMVDDKKNALQVGAFDFALEDYGAYIMYAIPNNNANLNELLKDIDEEVVKLQTDLISEQDYTKLMNGFENDFVSANTRMSGIARNLAESYTFYKNTNYINEALNEIKKITREYRLQHSPKDNYR